jgi:acyl-CoA thioester hydrolase
VYRSLPPHVAARAETLRVALPEHGGPKGLRPDPPRPDAGWAAADRLGLVLVQQGAVATAECDGQGLMLTRAYIGRIADAIPNLFARVGGVVGGDDGRTGGAALEYRLVYRAVPRAGDLLALRSGLKAVAGKATTWAHWLIDRESGAAIGTAEVVAVNLDLVARRAVDLDAATRRDLEARAIPGLTL